MLPILSSTAPNYLPLPCGASLYNRWNSDASTLHFVIAREAQCFHDPAMSFRLSRAILHLRTEACAG